MKRTLEISLIAAQGALAYNDDTKACWQIRLTDDNLFCSGNVSRFCNLTSLCFRFITLSLKKHTTTRKNLIMVRFVTPKSRFLSCPKLLPPAS